MNGECLDMINVGARKILIAGEASVSRARQNFRGANIGVKITGKITGCSPVILATPRTERKRGILGCCLRYSTPAYAGYKNVESSPRDPRNFVAQDTFRKFRPAEISVRARGVTETETEQWQHPLP